MTNYGADEWKKCPHYEGLETTGMASECKLSHGEGQQSDETYWTLHSELFSYFWPSQVVFLLTRLFLQN